MIKKIGLLIMSVSLISSSAHADWLDTLIDYGVPCLAGFALGSLADTSKNKTAIGMAVCGSTSLSTYLNQRNSKTEMMDEDFKKFVKLMNEKVDAKSLELELKQQQQLVELKDLMKEVMAERISNLEDEMKAKIQKHIDNNDFMKDVEAKLMKQIKENSVEQSKQRQKETVQKCVDEAINQIVKKRYGNSKDEIVTEDEPADEPQPNQ